MAKCSHHFTCTMKKLCLIADAIDTQYAGPYTYASMLIPALEATRPADWEMTYVHARPNSFFSGRNAWLVPTTPRFPGSNTYRRLVRLPALLRKIQCTVVHDLGHIAPFPRKQESYGKVLTIHDITPILFPGWHVWQSRFMHRWIFPRIVARADHLITVSETTKNDVARVLHPAVPMSPIPLAAKKLPAPKKRLLDAPYILCVSTLEPRKNLDMLLTAFTALRKNGSSLNLVLVGKVGWHAKELLAKIQQSPVRAYIHLPGFTSDEELSSWYAHARLAVYPSLYEGFGLPLLEAMGAGVPLICSDIPSTREVAGDAVLYVSPKDPRELAHAIDMLLTDSDLAARLQQKAQARAAQFSWEETARQTWAVYEQVASMASVKR